MNTSLEFLWKDIDFLNYVPDFNNYEVYELVFYLVNKAFDLMESFQFQLSVSLVTAVV